MLGVKVWMKRKIKKEGERDFIVYIYHWQPVLLVGMVQTARTNVASTVTAATDLTGTVSLDVRLDGKEELATMVQKDLSRVQMYIDICWMSIASSLKYKSFNIKLNKIKWIMQDCFNRMYIIIWISLSYLCGNIKLFIFLPNVEYMIIS